MIAFIGGQAGAGWQIYTIDPDTASLRRLTNFPRTAFISNLVWSPDGQALAYTFIENVQSPYHQVCTITLAGQRIRQLTLATRFNFVRQWLPDGRIIYNETVYPETIQPRPTADSFMCSINADGSREQRLFDHRQYINLVFSPDAAKLALISTADRRLAIARPDASHPQPIDSSGLEVQRVVWSPDGKALAFTAIRPHSRAMIYGDLFIYNETNRQTQRLGRILAGGSIFFSPDGCKLSAPGYHNHDFTIDIIDASTLQSRRLATVKEDPSSQDLPGASTWSADGKYVYFPTFVHPNMHLERAEVASGQIETILGAEAGFRSMMGFETFYPR